MIIVDRIENELAVCEIDGVMINIALSKISPGVQEGDVLIDTGDGVCYTIDIAETNQRKIDINKRFTRLKAKNKPLHY
jgi:hypothetical protein